MRLIFVLVLLLAIGMWSFWAYAAEVDVAGIDPQLLWTIGGVLLFLVLVVIVWQIERKHRIAMAENAALKSMGVGKIAPILSTDKKDEIVLKVSADTNQIEEALARVKQTIEDFSSAAISQFEAVVEAAHKAEVVLPPPPQSLASAYIDVQDFFKAVGTNFSRPVALDGKLVHNGTGEQLNYITESNGQISIAVSKNDPRTSFIPPPTISTPSQGVS